VDATLPVDVAKLPLIARRWVRIEDVFAVVADLKGSTNLGYSKHTASTASIYEAATGGLVKIYKEFGADFVQIQGDGGFALFWGDQAFERAICTAITVKTFSEKNLVKKLEKKWNEIPKTGFKVGVAASSLLVKRVGVPKTDIEEPVWVGKAVNYAAKCAQQADAHELIVTGSVWDSIEGNDYLSTSCGCGAGFGPGPSALWSPIEIEKIREEDGERGGQVLTSTWCDTHGSEFCEAILLGRTTRIEAKAPVESLRKKLASDAVWQAERRQREARRARRRGLK
jgi:class 3 adenylate cyclase